jgi:ankyrin repeat protein
MVQLFLTAGVDPTVVSKLGVTALDIAREFKNEAAIKILSELPSAKK